MIKINSGIKSILSFEYYTGSGINDPEIISEAIALTNSLLNDFFEGKFDDVAIYFILSKEFEYLKNDFDSGIINFIIINEKLESWLNKNLDKFNGVMFISAEENMNLYNLTKLIEDNGLEVYGSSSKATLLCSNKYLTFKHLQNIVNQPKTFKFTISEDSRWELAIKNLLELFSDDTVNKDEENSKDKTNNKTNNKNNINNNENDGNSFKLIIKPLYGVDCQDMVIISDLEDISKIKDIYPTDSEILVQEFISGENLSVSLISDGETAIPISLNKQYINIDKESQHYLGGELPYSHPLKEEIFSVAKKAIESIEGIKGFVGVDLIVDESKDNSIYFLEINSRFTTPYVALNKIAKFNIGKKIIELLDNKIAINSLYEEIDFENKIVQFRKKDNDLDIEII